MERSTWSSLQFTFDVTSHQLTLDNRTTPINKTLRMATRRLAGAIAKTGPPLHEGQILIWFTALYVLVLVCGLLGNLLTIAVVRRTRDLQSNTNLFLCNLAISDLMLLTSGIPFDLVYMWRTYPAIGGTWFCILKGEASTTSN